MEKLKSLAEILLSDLAFSEHELSILITDDAEMAELNGTYRGKPYTTDVLSFRLSEAESGAIAPDILGDIVISLDQAESQAIADGKAPVVELVFLLIHGLLHLAGYDHEDVPEADAIEMRRLEQVLFAKLIPLV